MNSIFELDDEEYFGVHKPAKKEIHVLIELPTSRLSKKARIEPSELHTLLAKIKAFDWKCAFDVESVMEVPFPSLSMRPNRFRLNDNRCFQYQSRQDLEPLFDEVVTQWKEKISVTMNIVGTIGYGKSHMLTVLVLLLLKNHKGLKAGNGAKPFVCFIPDCSALRSGHRAVLSIMRNAVLLNIPDYPEPLISEADIRSALLDRQVILIADQWNSIDNEDEGSKSAKHVLDSCLGPSVLVEIHGMPMNAKTWRSTLHKQTVDINKFYNGGFNDDEFGVWLLNHHKIFRDNEDELAVLTGKVPFTLDVFDRVRQDSDSWENIVRRVQQDPSVLDWSTLLTEFYANCDGDVVWKVYSLSVMPDTEGSIVDHRFFYKDATLGFRATSEIVMRLLYRIWTTKVPDNGMLTRWHLILNLKNRSILGFQVEEIIKAQYVALV